MADELSQDEIDQLFGGTDESDNADNQVNETAKKLFDLLNASLEEVLKTAFSLEVVSKFIDLKLSNKDDIVTENKISVNIELSSEDKNVLLVALIDKRFASILSDLMLMGPGEAKDELTDEDLDALKELFSQVFGNLSTVVKEQIPVVLEFAVKDASLEVGEFSQDNYYCAQYDIALPNIEDGTVEICADKSLMDDIFKKEETLEEEPQEVPFSDVEEATVVEQPKETPAPAEVSVSAKNLDLIMDIDLEVKIRIGEKQMLIKDILDLKDGSIIELDKNIEEPMDILVNGKVVAQGVVVVVGGKFGVKITKIQTKEQRIKSLGG